VIRRGEIWWANLPNPRAAQPGFQRPVVVVSADAFNRSDIRTVVVAVVTSALRLADAPGNVRISKRDSKLPKASVVNVSQLLTLDKGYLDRRAGRLPESKLAELDRGLYLALGLGVPGV